MAEMLDYASKAADDCTKFLGTDVASTSLLHSGRQNAVIKVTGADGKSACVRYRTAVEFWYEDCIKEPFIQSLGVVDIPKVYFADDKVRPQILISEFVEGPMLHDRGVTPEIARKVGKLIANLHQPANGASNYTDFTQGKRSKEAWADTFVASINEEALKCGFDPSDVSDLSAFTRTTFGAQSSNGLVLVHNDIHFKNMIERPNGSICLFDWDSAMIAPPEKDFVKLLDWSHANTTTVPKIVEAYQEERGAPLNKDAIEIFRIYACLRQIHYQTVAAQKGVDKSVLEQKGFFDDNQKHLERMNHALNGLGMPSWRLQQGQFVAARDIPATRFDLK